MHLWIRLYIRANFCTSSLGCSRLALLAGDGCFSTVLFLHTYGALADIWRMGGTPTVVQWFPTYVGASPHFLVILLVAGLFVAVANLLVSCLHGLTNDSAGNEVAFLIMSRWYRRLCQRCIQACCASGSWFRFRVPPFEIVCHCVPRVHSHRVCYINRVFSQPEVSVGESLGKV